MSCNNRCVTPLKDVYKLNNTYQNNYQTSCIEYVILAVTNALQLGLQTVFKMPVEP